MIKVRLMLSIILIISFELEINCIQSQLSFNHPSHIKSETFSSFPKKNFYKRKHVPFKWGKRDNDNLSYLLKYDHCIKMVQAIISKSLKSSKQIKAINNYDECVLFVKKLLFMGIVDNKNSILSKEVDYNYDQIDPNLIYEPESVLVNNNSRKKTMKRYKWDSILNKIK